MNKEMKKDQNELIWRVTYRSRGKQHIAADNLSHHDALQREGWKNVQFGKQTDPKMYEG